MGSYLSELSELVSQSREPTKDPVFSPTKVYARFLEYILESAIWVYFDQYNDISGAAVVSKDGKMGTKPIARIDMRAAPIVTIKSTVMISLLNDICVSMGGYMERKTIVDHLKARQSKLVLLAGLRQFESHVERKFPSVSVLDARSQQRCMVFPLEVLVELAGRKLSGILPDEAMFIE